MENGIGDATLTEKLRGIKNYIFIDVACKMRAYELNLRIIEETKFLLRALTAGSLSMRVVGDR